MQHTWRGRRFEFALRQGKSGPYVELWDVTAGPEGVLTLCTTFYPDCVKVTHYHPDAPDELVGWFLDESRRLVGSPGPAPGDGGSAMSENAFETCPRCGAALQAGFAAKAIGLSFVAPDKLERFAFLDEDLAKSGLRKLLPSKADYFRSYLCRSCDLYLIDFGTTLDRGQAEQVARSLTGPA
jgi:hypothetical protein